MNATVQLNMLHLRLLEYKHVLYTPICYSCHWCSLACSCLNEIPAVIHVFSFERSFNIVLCLFVLFRAIRLLCVLCDSIIIFWKTTFDIFLLIWYLAWSLRALVRKLEVLVRKLRGLVRIWKALCGNLRACVEMLGACAENWWACAEK